MRLAISLIATLILTGCTAPTSQADNAKSADASHASEFLVDVWADNWFSLSVNGTQVAEDSVPITTERSFNAETFSFSAERPFVLGLVAKDFKANDTGLEYIGTPRQQIGDGGVILQVFDVTNNLVAVSDERWKCLVVHHAPVEKSCAQEQNPVAGEGACGFERRPEPEGWNTLSFDASDWPDATVHSARDVRPKDGYNEIKWNSAAKIIWGPDLETDNTLLCRLVVR